MLALLSFRVHPPTLLYASVMKCLMLLNSDSEETVNSTSPVP